MRRTRSGSTIRGWTLIPALRVDYYDLSPQTDRIYREDNPSTSPVGVDDLSFAPKLGATLSRSTIGFGVFFQYSHGFRSPPPEDVNIGLEIPLFNVRAIPNPDLQPETSDGFEVGVRLTGSPFALTASVYDTEYRDFIESKVNLGVDPAHRRDAVPVAERRGSARSTARDSTRVSMQRRGRGDCRAGRRDWPASWLRGDDRTRNVPLNSIDPPRVVLGVRYDAPRPLGLELAVTAVEAQRDVDRSRADLYRTDGYATLDWLANVSFSPRLRLNVGLFNLTDTEYIEWADVRGRVVGDPLIPYYTRAGFNASASLRYDF